LLCPSDPNAGLLDNARLPDRYLPGNAGTFSMGQSYVPSAGPIAYAGCTISPMDPNINCINTGPAGGGGRFDQGSPGMFAGGYKCYSIRDCTDGSVRFIPDEVDYVTWQYLGNKSDGGVIESYQGGPTAEEPDRPRQWLIPEKYGNPSTSGLTETIPADASGTLEIDFNLP